MPDELQKIVLFAIERIAPERRDLLRDVENVQPPAMTANKTFSANSRAESLAALYYEVSHRTGDAKARGEKELRSVILEQFLPLMHPDCIPLSRMVEIRDEVADISLRYVNGELSEEQYKAALRGDK